MIIVECYKFSGVGGNLVAVQASRISTSLHKTCRLGTLPEDAKKGCNNPIKVFFSNSEYRNFICFPLFINVLYSHEKC